MKLVLHMTTALVSVGLLYTTAAIAAPADGQAISLEEIVVTAQRREQSLQDVPVSITAFTEATIREQNIRTASDYLALTPNVSFTEDGKTGNSGINISIRGISDIKTGENSVTNSIGIYLDEFSVVSVAGGTINPQLQDVERIEVLRGPQGTYFGRNAVGGALNIVTKKPTDRYEAEATIGGYAYDGAGDGGLVSGVLNIPVSNTLMMRFVAQGETNSGIVRNADPRGAKNSGFDSYGGRMAIRWLPDTATTVDFLAMYNKQDEGHDPTVPSGVLDLDTQDTLGIHKVVDDGIGFWPNNQNRLSHNVKESNKSDSVLLNLRVSHNFTDEIALKSVTGFIRTTQDRIFDQDQTSLDILQRDNAYSGSSWSQELRLEVTKSAFDFVVGGLYAQDNQKQYNNIFMKSERQIDGVYVLPPVIPGVFPSGTVIDLKNKRFKTNSLAFFVDSTWHATDRLDVTVGGRYTHDKIVAGLFDSQGFAGQPMQDIFSGKSFNDFSPRAVMTFKPDEAMTLYASVSKGYKAGGVSVGYNSNLGNQPFAEPFKAENLWNYEAGFKTDLWNGRMRLNGAAFYSNWKNMQLESLFFMTPGDISSNVQLTRNVDKARVYGFEAEAVAAVTRNLTLNGAVGYLNSKINCDCEATITGGRIVDLTGLAIPKAPEWTLNLGAEYRHDVSFGDMYVRLDWLYHSKQYSDIEALTWAQTGQPEFPYKVPSYNVVNLRTGINWTDRLSINFYVENLLKEQYYTGTQEKFGVSGIRLRPHPRIFGLSVTVKSF
ncbi:TonB-dependent receptor [Govanella unica]|uniref:TonB-dependent receptor n=1 Tax=Govanella unica TaxID=2975056 RepID=A0A9X3Z866_9PROT|nr:TonB-dependent receptor [Govania unica]MDA5195030.1 TonB-dependent receptor [Govania unica]